MNLEKVYPFYNGLEDFPQEQIMKLSDSFYMEDGYEQPQLELTARMININLDKGHSILVSCPILGQYSEFVARVRKYAVDRNTLARVVKSCIDDGILKDFLERHMTEVINIMRKVSV